MTKTLEDQARLTNDVGFRLSRLARHLRAQWGERLSVLGLTQPQAAILRALRERPNIGLRELSRMIGADPSNLRKEIERLTRDEYVHTPGVSQPGRKATLSLTTKGEAMTTAVVELSVDQARSSFGRLDPADQLALILAIAKLEAIVGIGDHYGSPRGG
ncbi:MAG: MarR family winged helix-turn-helix transcriptional regulator [Ferrimicrobium sp.]